MADAHRIIRRNLGLRLWLSGGWLGLLALTALLAPWISPQDPLAQDLFAARLPPFWSDGAEPGFWLGSDSLGRDVLSRIIFGARIALTVALVAGVVTCLVGATLGLIAGYFRGWIDLVVSRLIEIWMAFPPVLFAILLIAVLGPGLWSIIIAIVVIDWTRFARVVRAETMSQSAMDYVASAQVAGRSRVGTMLAEILPNVLATIVTMLTLEMGIADEPTTALDVVVQKQILHLIRDMQQSHGTALLFVTHDLTVVSKICQSLTILYAGKVIEETDVNRFFNEPSHPYSAALLAPTPKYTDPDRGLMPVPQSVIDAVQDEIDADDRLSLL